MLYCEPCNYMTKDRGNYSRHKKTSKHIGNTTAIDETCVEREVPTDKTKEKKYACGLCNSVFKKKYNLKRHIRSFCPALKPKKLTDDDITGYNPTEKSAILRYVGINAGIVQNPTRIMGKFINLSDDLHDIMREFGLKPKYIKCGGTICPFCDEAFARKDSRNRHMNTCGSVNVYIEKYKTRKVEKEMETYKDKNNKMESALITNSNNTSMSKLNQISNKYPDADPLTLLSCEDYMNNIDIRHIPKRPYMDLEQRFVEAILSAHKNKGLVKYLSDTLVSMYSKPEDPDSQSVWCTDTSRLRYVVMRNIDNSVSWMGDPGGEYTKEKIIDPLMENIKGLLDKYDSYYYYRKYERWLKKEYPTDITMHVPDKEYQSRYMRYQKDSNKIFNDIKGGKLQKKILVYMSMHFNYDKSTIKDIK